MFNNWPRFKFNYSRWAPRASSHARAELSVQPVPWVFFDSMWGRANSVFSPFFWHKTSITILSQRGSAPWVCNISVFSRGNPKCLTTILGKLEMTRSMSDRDAVIWPPLRSTERQPYSSNFVDAEIMSSIFVILMAWPPHDSSASASDLLGVTIVAKGNSSCIRTPRAWGCKSVCPDVDTQTGSQTRAGTSLYCALSALTTALIVSASNSMPVLIASIGISWRTEVISSFFV